MKRNRRVAATLAIVSFVWTTLFIYGQITNTGCPNYDDYEPKLSLPRLNCAKGYFHLPGMQKCRRWLNCSDINNDVHMKTVIGSGFVKTVYKAEWNGYEVIVNTPSGNDLEHGFRAGQMLLQSLQPSHHVTQLLGTCGDLYVTEYHKLGNSGCLHEMMTSPKLSSRDSLKLRFELCIQYAQVLELMHNSSGPNGTKVLCDTKNLRNTLRQYLITSDFKLVLNDLDYINSLPKEGVWCSPNKETDPFNAPEQIWPYWFKRFDPKKIKKHDEKTDIWKIPSICEYFLGNFPGSSDLKKDLKIHKQCKLQDPKDRPSATEVLREYSKTLHTFNFS